VSGIESLDFNVSADCSDTILATLTSLLQLPIIAQYQRSPIYVFTDALSNDVNADASVITLLTELGFWRPQVSNQHAQSIR
jgi:hypothetical protein